MQLSALYQNMGGDGADLYKYVKSQIRQVVISDAINQLVPENHKVADKGLRPDKIIFVPNGEVDPVTQQPVMVMDTAPVTRAPLAIQKYIISQKASFAVGNGIEMKPSDVESKVYQRVYDNWISNKTDFDLKEIAERMMGETQVAVIFYGEKGADTLDDFKFKYKLVSPLKGDTLYPFFDDDTDDLIAFGREYKRGRKTIYDLYYVEETSGLVEIRRFESKKPMLTDEGFEVVIKTQYTKLPIIYWEQAEGECNDTVDIINELECGFSDFLTGLGYTADPILFAKGSVMDLPAKGSAGKFIESTDPSADLKYVTPDNATEARELQFTMLQKYIFSLNRAVLLDLETLKGLGATSGAALERYLIDVYMEATGKQQGEWGKGVQRMVNWLTAAWTDLESSSEKIRIDVKFTKYSMTDQFERVELAMKANGDKPVVDQETSIYMAGLVDDVAGTLEKINATGE